MAATEGLQIGVVNLAYDPALIKRNNFTDVNTKVLSRVDFFRVAGNVHLCTVIINVAVIDWKNGAYPIATKINQTKGITVMELS